MKKLPDEWFVDAVKKRGHSEESIKAMTPQQFFNEFCNWNGLMGDWGPTLWDLMEQLKEDNS